MRENHRACKTCAGKDFVFCEGLKKIRRCMDCNPPLASFTLGFIPDMSGDKDDRNWQFAEAMAEAFEEVVTALDYEEARQKF